MADKPSKPEGQFELRNEAYAHDSLFLTMSDSEFAQGRNNTGEVETPLGSVPNAQKDNWLFRYLNEHIIYIEQMLDYILEKGGW